MHITIEENKCIVNLDETEFPKFEAMFANLQPDKHVSVEFRRFPDFGGTWQWTFAPMHLCRTIGEANLSADPFATISLYPFWKHGFAFADSDALSLKLGIEDSHKKGVAADEFGMGFCAWAMEEIFRCEFWADASAMIESGLVVPTGSRAPDFVCTFDDDSLGIFEAKGTTGTVSALTQALKTGKFQTMALDAQSPIRHRVVVGVALGDPLTKVIVMDPDEDSVRAYCNTPLRTNLSADLVKRAAKNMRKPIVGSRPASTTGEAPPMETLFRGPADGTGTAREIKLVRTEYKDEKRHGWLDTE